MSSNQKTPYYNLSQFQDTDKPSWRGDYNGDMSKIDTGMQEVKTTAIDAKTAAQEVKTTAIDAKTAAQNAESSVSEIKRDYLKKTDAQNTYTTKTELNDTKTTIENNANNTFVTKSVYNENIAKKADKTSVYTKTESDNKFALKTASTETQSQLDALATLTRPLTSWAARAHGANDETKSFSADNPMIRMTYPVSIKTNNKYVTYNEANGMFTFHEGSYLIMVRGRIQNVNWSDNNNRKLRVQFAGPHSDIMFDDCKQGMGDNQEYSMWGLLRVGKNETFNASTNISYWTPPSGVSVSFKIEEASIAIILLQSETYDE